MAAQASTLPNVTQDDTSYDPPPVVLPLRALTHEGFRRWWRSGQVPEGCRVTFARDVVLVNLLEHEMVEVPVTARTLAGFRRWAVSDEFPQRGRISFLKDHIFIDMSPEEIETHNKIKTENTRVLGNIALRDNSGTLYSDRTLITHRVGLSSEPDAAFATWDTLRTGRLRPVTRKKHPEEYMELEGTPDWVLEIISRSSITKDRKRLRALYHAAGVPEYWLIDALGEEIEFQILLRRAADYVSARPRDGWLRSRAFGREFRLLRRRDPVGLWRYTLQSRKV